MQNSNLISYKGYHTRPEFSAGDRMFHGVILGIDDVVDYYAENAKDLEREFQNAVDDYLALCQEIGKEPQKEYSGTFNVRIAPDLHKRLALAAQADGISLNREVERAIAAFV